MITTQESTPTVPTRPSRVLTYQPTCHPDHGSDTVEALLRAHRAHPADVIVVHTPDTTPSTAVRQVLAQDSSASVFVAGCQTDAVALAEAISAGARGFLQRGRPATGSGPAGNRPTGTHPGDLHPTEHRRSSRRHRAAVGNRLTGRELEVLTAMSLGLTNAEIAAALQVSCSTVKVYAQHVFLKLGTRERAEAVAVAFRDGLLT